MTEPQPIVPLGGNWIERMRSEPGWTPWHGGQMPVPAGTMVDLAWADGDCEINQDADLEDWTLTEGEEAIVAYRYRWPASV